jgi:hypothetical protein
VTPARESRPVIGR